MIYVALFIGVWFGVNLAFLVWQYRVSVRHERRMSVLERVQRPQRSYLERRRIARTHRDRDAA